MDANPYSPPMANLETADASRPEYYVVSIGKFTLLYFATLGIYGIYWFYRNWKAYKDFTGEKMWPIPRAIFNVFFAHALFAKIDAKLCAHGGSFEWSHKTVATWYVVLTVASNVLDRLASKEIGSPISDVLSILILPAMYYTLLLAQKALNMAEGDPEGEANSTLSGANFVWMLFGALLWMIIIVGFGIMLGILPEDLFGG